MPNAPLKVLVVGASIAGPATAYWLARTGARVTVLERFPALRTGGQAVDIRTCGVSVMRKLGIESRVRAETTGEEGICFVRDNGRPYGAIRTTGNADRQGIVSEYEINRGALSGILYDMTRDHPKIEYQFGEEIASMTTAPDGSNVGVEYKNGTPGTTYDLVVACDGAFSRTRAMGLGCKVGDHVGSTNSWAAYYTTSKDYLNGSMIGHGYSTPGGRFISVGSDIKTNKSKVLMSVNCSTPRQMKGFRQAVLGGTDQVKAYIANEYSGMGWITPALIKEMMTSGDFYASEIVQVKVPTLYADRVVLVGDAGYAAGPTGGGTSLALTGGYILAGELARQSGDLQAGLRAYEETIRPIIKELQVIPPLVGTIMAPQSAWGIWIRNWAFGLIAWTGLAEVAQRYLGPAFADTKEYPLPHYEWDRDRTSRFK